jgi:hypothetical protein
MMPGADDDNGLHPLNVEGVVWIAARQHLLGACFFLLALAAYGFYAMRPGVSRYILAAGIFAVGLMAKPIVTLPFCCLLLDFWPVQRLQGRSPSPSFPVPQFSFWQLIREKIPLLALSAASCVITMIVQRVTVEPQDEQWPIVPRIYNAIYSYTAYLGKAFLPIHLVPFYPFEGCRISGSFVLLCLLLLTAASVAVCRWRSNSYLPTGWLWFLGTLVPVIGLVPFARQAMADRYAYLPLIGIFVIVVWGAGALAERFTCDPGQWWNPFLYWDPIAHPGGDEYRTPVGPSSFHFRRPYPSCPIGPVLNPASCFFLQTQMVGRKTKLDQFHTDPHDPARDPWGHIRYDVF